MPAGIVAARRDHLAGDGRTWRARMNRTLDCQSVTANKVANKVLGASGICLFVEPSRSIGASVDALADQAVDTG